MGAEGLVLTTLALIAGLLLVAGLLQALQPPARRRVRYGAMRHRRRVPARRGEAVARRPHPGLDLRSAASPALAQHRDLADGADLAAEQAPPAAPGVEPGAAPDERAREASIPEAETLVERQEFLRARRLIWEALGDEELPADRRDTFKEILSAAYAGEIAQLTADAGAAARGERDAEPLELLQRADGLLASIPDDALTPARGAELQRCVWEGYRTLGTQRLEAGAVESGLELLLRALALAPADSASQRETRTVLVRALEAVVNAGAEEVGRLLKDGQQAAALAESERLLGVLREGMAAGLLAEELREPLGKARRAIDQVLPG